MSCRQTASTSISPSTITTKSKVGYGHGAEVEFAVMQSGSDAVAVNVGEVDE